MNRISLIKNILFTTFSILLFVFTLVLYIQSFENKMYKSKVSFDEKYVLYILISICFIILAIYNFVMEYKNKKKNPLVLFITVTLAAFVLSLYNLGSFFSALLDYWEGEYFVFKDNQLNLYTGIAAFILFLAFVFKYLEFKKDSKNNK